MRDHLIIFDTQVKPESDTRMMRWFGQYMLDHKPEVVVMIGDHWDMPSLSSYDKSTKRAEGKRYRHDIQAGNDAIDDMMRPITEYNIKMKEQKKKGYSPELHFCIGNHEERIIKHVNANPNLDGLIGFDDFNLRHYSFNVHSFLEPIKIDGVQYVHYVKNRNSNYPKTTAKTIMAQEKVSTTCGHQPCFDLYGDWSNATGGMAWALICGSSYLDEEDYRKGTGNQHFRGIVHKRNVHNGDYDMERISLKQLEGLYG